MGSEGIAIQMQDIILGYGVMVTQQILVLFFLVRVRVSQHEGSTNKYFLFFEYVVSKAVELGAALKYLIRSVSPNFMAQRIYPVGTACSNQE